MYDMTTADAINLLVDAILATPLYAWGWILLAALVLANLTIYYHSER